MTEKELASMLQTIGVPIARNGFKKKQSPPYIVYTFAYSNNYAADSKVYLKRNNYQVELYTDKKEPGLELALENILDENEIIYDKTETYIATEDMLQVVYEIQLIGG